MPDYNNLSFSDGLSLGDSLNYSAKLPEDFINRAGQYAQSIYGPPPPQDVMRYPLQAIEKEQDMLLIRIFDNVKNKFGIQNIVQGDYQDYQDENGKKITKLENFKGFSALKTKNQAFNNPDNQKQLKQNSRYIWLPIPQQVSDSISVGYSEDTLNPLQAAGMAIAAEGITNPVEAAGKVIDLIKKFDASSISQDNLNSLQTALAGQAINQLGANVNPQSLITRSSGQILQSNLELLFNNVTLRSFPFTFDFTPRDPDEADMVKRIIRTIKKATVPKRGNGLFINSPDLFQFEYVAGGERQHPFLNKFKVGVIENVSVDYTASGTYATYDDRTPVHIRMSLAFKEINPIYAEDYDAAAATDNGLEGGVGY